MREIKKIVRHLIWLIIYVICIAPALEYPFGLIIVTLLYFILYHLVALRLDYKEKRKEEKKEK